MSLSLDTRTSPRRLARRGLRDDQTGGGWVPPPRGGGGRARGGRPRRGGLARGRGRGRRPRFERRAGTEDPRRERAVAVDEAIVGDALDLPHPRRRDPKNA